MLPVVNVCEELNVVSLVSFPVMTSTLTDLARLASFDFLDLLPCRLRPAFSFWTDEFAEHSGDESRDDDEDDCDDETESCSDDSEGVDEALDEDDDDDDDDDVDDDDVDDGAGDGELGRRDMRLDRDRDRGCTPSSRVAGGSLDDSDDEDSDGEGDGALRRWLGLDDL